MYIFYISVIGVLILSIINLRKSNNNILLEKDSTISIRGISILFIMFHHIAQHITTDGILNKLNLIGYLCVAIFFLLSGYGNYFSFQKNKDKAEKFIFKRILRIFITFWCVWVIDLILVYIVEGNIYSIKDIMYQCVTLTLPYLINWYLKIQVVAYILFYIAFVFFKNKSSEILLLLTIIITIIMIALNLDSYWWNTIICFGIGAMLAKYKNEVSNLILKYNKYILICISFIVFIVLFKLGVSIPYLTILSAISICMFATVILFYYNLKSKVLTFMGNITLETYLWHAILLKLILDNNNLNINLNLIIVAFLSLSIACSYISSKLIKRIMNAIQ